VAGLSWRPACLHGSCSLAGAAGLLAGIEVPMLDQMTGDPALARLRAVGEGR
jgi:hypothetical protein